MQKLTKAQEYEKLMSDLRDMIKLINPNNLLSKEDLYRFSSAILFEELTEEDKQVYALSEAKKCYNAFIREFDKQGTPQHARKAEKITIQKYVMQNRLEPIFYGLTSMFYITLKGQTYSFTNPKITLTQDEIKRVSKITSILDTFPKF